MRNKKGFSLLEVMTAMFIFVLVMMAVSISFSSLFGGYSSAKSIQKDLESAQYSMNLMAKSLRTSSIVDPNSPGNVSRIIFYNYSEKKCVSYRFNEGKLQMAEVDDPNDGISGSTFSEKRDWCSTVTFSEYSNLVAKNVNSLSFYVVPSDDTAGSEVLGKVTISIEICASSGCSSAKKDVARIQTSVSLRTYKEAGI
ncbi:MAG: prepilin-type N-terminal cleavage/methylation domain-containing protein [Parcubacteria group bacterium]